MLGFGSSGRIGLGLIAVSLLTLIPGEGRAQQATPTLTYAAQGWSVADRETFYTTSQGSRMMPLAWFKALRRHDAEELFAADQLKRYGYIPNESPGNTNGLPIGFVVDKRAPTQLGMTCQPNSQVLQEYPEMTKLQAEFNELLAVRAPEKVQMAVRVGRAKRAYVALRRDPQDFLINSPPSAP